MKALLYQGPRDIRCEDFADPGLADDRDAIVKMTRCGICGSDLHIYHGQGFSPDLGFCVGHEAVGEVVEVGRGVNRLKVGDPVMLSAAVGCGACGIGVTSRPWSAAASAISTPTPPETVTRPTRSFAGRCAVAQAIPISRNSSMLVAR